MKKQNRLNNYNQKIDYYIDVLTGTGYLALRDISQIINEYSNGGKKTLDFGCGAGRSTRFLKNLGLDVDGVDIDEKMLYKAKELDADGHYFLIQSHDDLNTILKYDVIFNLFVLFEFSNKTALLNYLTAFHTILQTGGILVSVVNSEFLFSKNWISVINDFEQNKNLQSGNIAKVMLPEQGNIELNDYYFSESDYIDLFEKAGFSILNIHKPIGNLRDPYQWKDEYLFPPYAIYVCKKI